MPGFNDVLVPWPYITNYGVTVNYTFNPTTFIEATYGSIKNELAGGGSGGLLVSPKANRLTTPSGRIEIFSDRIASFGYDDCPGHPVWMEPYEWLGAAAATEYPLHLISNQPRTRLHSQFDPGRVSQASKVQGREPMVMHPALDAHGNANMLTRDKGTSRLGQGPSAHSALVEVERFNGDAPPVTAFVPPEVRVRR